MTEKEALDLAIFAINTLVAPDASDNETLNYVVDHANDAIKVLASMRVFALTEVPD